MKTKRIHLITVLLVMIGVSCDDPYNDNLDNSDPDFVLTEPHLETELDHWLFDNFTSPYNIEIKYRWSGGELDVNSTLVPPSTEKVQSIMNVVKDAWIVPYTEEAGEVFLKTYCPKQFVLVGSPEYNAGGTITLGTAEGGRKVVLYMINDFEETDRAKIKQQMHTVHHEFAHILHQNILYPAAFKEVTPGAYTADWRNTTTADAQSQGFVTPYSMSSPDEDFVEIIATMLTEGKRGFDRLVCSIPSETARELIRRKEQFVVNYYTDAYGVDFYKLQQKTDEAIDKYAPKSLLSDLGNGSGQHFNTIRVNPDELPPFPSGFQDIYDVVADNIEANTSTTLDYFQLTFDGYGGAGLIVELLHDNGVDRFTAVRIYSVSTTEGDIVTFLYEDENSIAELIADDIQPLLEYFENNTFHFDWIENDSDGCVNDLGGIYPQELSSSYNSFGVLAN